MTDFKFPCYECFVLPMCKMKQICVEYCKFINLCADSFELMTADEIAYIRTLPQSVGNRICEFWKEQKRYAYPEYKDFTQIKDKKRKVNYGNYNTDY